MFPLDFDVTDLVKAYGYVAVGCIVGFESLGIPIPGEWALVVAAAYAGTTHDLNIEMIVLAASTGALCVGSGGYWIGRHLGFPLLKRYGRYVLLDQSRLKVACLRARTAWAGVIFSWSTD